jgi:hypothetical protein
VDEEQGKVVGKDPIVADLKSGDKEDWVVAEATRIPEGKVLDTMKLKQIATAVANVKIVGVRPRPELESMPVQVAIGVLQPKGFFVSMGQGGGPQLFGNEGQVSVVTKDGIVYTLLFGEVTYESGLALTAGAEGEETKPEEGAPEEGKPEGEDAKAANRYMFVNVSYDPSRDQSSTTPEEPEEPEGEDAGEDEDEPSKLEGQARAEQLSKRFGSWFYVISDSSFKQIHKERDEMFKDAPKDEKKKQEDDAGGDQPPFDLP